MKNENIFGISKYRIVNLERTSPRPRIEEKARTMANRVEIPACRQLEHKVHDTSVVGGNTYTRMKGQEKEGRRSMDTRRERERKTGRRRGSKQLCVKRRKLARDEKIEEKKARREKYDENVRSLSPFLSSPRLAGCICYWVALARDTRGGHIGGRRRVATPTTRGGGGGGEAGKLRRGGWLTETASQLGGKGWRSSDAAADDNDDDDGRQRRWLSREDRRHSE